MQECRQRGPAQSLAVSAFTPFDMYATQGSQSMTDLPDALPAQVLTMYLWAMSALLSLVRHVQGSAEWRCMLCSW